MPIKKSSLLNKLKIRLQTKASNFKIKEKYWKPEITPMCPHQVTPAPCRVRQAYGFPQRSGWALNTVYVRNFTRE